MDKRVGEGCVQLVSCQHNQSKLPPFYLAGGTVYTRTGLLFHFQYYSYQHRNIPLHRLAFQTTPALVALVHTIPFISP